MSHGIYLGMLLRTPFVPPPAFPAAHSTPTPRLPSSPRAQPAAPMLLRGGFFFFFFHFSLWEEVCFLGPRVAMLLGLEGSGTEGRRRWPCPRQWAAGPCLSQDAGLQCRFRAVWTGFVGILNFKHSIDLPGKSSKQNFNFLELAPVLNNADRVSQKEKYFLTSAYIFSYRDK